MPQPLRTSLLFLAALFAGLAAALNVIVILPHLRADLAELQVRRTLVAAISLGLGFGALAMAAFALLLLAAALRAARGEAPDRAQLWILASAFLAFGLGAFLLGGGGHHLLGYAFIGALVAGAAALPGGGITLRP